MTTSGRDREHIIEALRAALESRAEIVFAYLHGSFVTGGPYRDIDVAVWLDADRVPSAQRLSWALDTAARLSVDLRARIDVQVVNDASPAFRYHALDGELLFTRDAELVADVRARTWDEYFDLAPFARRYLADVLGA